MPRPGPHTHSGNSSTRFRPAHLLAQADSSSRTGSCTRSHPVQDRSELLLAVAPCTHLVPPGARHGSGSTPVSPSWFRFLRLHSSACAQPGPPTRPASFPGADAPARLCNRPSPRAAPAPRYSSVVSAPRHRWPDPAPHTGPACSNIQTSLLRGAHPPLLMSGIPASSLAWSRSSGSEGKNFLRPDPPGPHTNAAAAAPCVWQW